MLPISVSCPACGESFEMLAPPASELPADVDYVCEICCRPLRIQFELLGGEITAVAYGPGEEPPQH